MFNVYAHVYENFENKKKNSRNPKVLKKPILYVAENLVANKICTFHRIGESYDGAPAYLHITTTLESKVSTIMKLSCKKSL